jgi:hypothetical protein
MRIYHLVTIAVLAQTSALSAAPARRAAHESAIPRTADGKPNFQGIWQATSTAPADLQDHAASVNMPAGRSVLAGGAAIPYQPWAAAKRTENFRNRLKDDPLSQCYMPGTPRIMYMDFPFQIFQTPKAIALTFEWSLIYRLISTDGSPHQQDVTETWMGDSRGRWEGDTLVVDVRNYNDQTWFDMAGDFHSAALHVEERYRMTGRDTIQYDATIEDAKVFTKPWTISLALHRRADRNRLYEYVCQGEVEETNGAFTREERTWYPGDGTNPPAMPMPALVSGAPTNVTANIRRTPDGKPDLQGFYESKTAGANQGLQRRGPQPGVIVDPSDGTLPLLPWGAKETESRNLAERGYDDPTAHCFPAGVPRSMYVPAALHIIQTPEYIVFLHERMAWRIVPLDGRAHLPDTIRLWQGDSVGRWEGDTLVIDTTNLNGKTWLNEGGEVVSYAEHVVERFTPTGPDLLRYDATVADPVVYARPWTISFPVAREKFEMYESTCHETDHDLPHLKAIKDAAAANKP